ncbi:ABC transporter ATP-binding protein [bacterium]|nr:ABC transporter ATP-binding protein [bacterium]MBU1064648.1 ABC transporter ATP-binding protein [bacterium]MBU1633109.1 ABC transporter ATP-binding protein [bacterium]MBU1874271.1 ABC transporter ATP-binding protein [bacterium]
MMLQTFNLSKRFGSRQAVKDLNLSVEKGQVFGFLGPNGAGKSTTIRMLLNLIRPSSGSFELLSQNVKSSGQKIYSRIGALVEKPDFYLYLSAEKNLKILGSLSGGVDKERINAVLEIVRLQDRARENVRNYSHGMKQRLGIAQALLNQPELVILDEPTSGLDPEGIHEMRELIVSLAREQDMTVVLSSHLLHEIEQVCTHMAIIDNGSLIVQGSVEELLRKTDFYVTEISVDNPERAFNHLKTEKWVKDITLENGLLKVHVSVEKRPVLAEFLIHNHFKVFSIVPRTSLEDYYLSLLKTRHG